MASLTTQRNGLARCLGCALLLFFVVPIMSMAQAAAAAAPAAPAVGAGGPIVFGGSDMPLYGPWKFHVGDSPVDPVTDAPLWAQPGFDDSAWETVSLKPRRGWVDPYNGDQRYIPGWTANGHPGYMGYAWYRLRVPATAKKGARLALTCPVYVDDGYQVFGNGELLGELGGFGTNPPRVSSTVPLMLLLPEASSGGAGDGAATQVIAFRVWMGPMGLTHSPYAGGLHYAPYLGEAGAIASRTRLDWLELARQSAYAPFEGVLLFLLGMVAAGLTLFDRSDRVYLWVAAVLLFTALTDAALTVFTLTHVLSQRTYFMFFDVFANPLVLCGWIMVWWYWFRLLKPAWMPKAIAGLMLLYMVTKAIGGDFFYGADLHAPASAVNMISVVVRLVFLPLFIFIVGLGIREQGSEGWLVLPAVVPLAVSQFASELIAQNLPVKWAPFGITIFVGQVSNLVSAAAISLLLLRRLFLSVGRQRRMALDVRQAQEVQQVILPETRMVVPGLMIESEFRPAEQVSGDFFQIVPDERDGSLLIVVGDVNGKGLRAGMLVALLVGAIRSTAQFDCDPVVMLDALNKQLIGRGDAIATCLALRIGADGEAVLANAGHLPPYLNGELLSVEGSLPLGMIESAEFSNSRFKLNEDDHLVLISDGIAEARNSEGQLFGFERVQDLLRNGKTVAEVASAAQSFGQDDDISAIAVTRTAVTERSEGSMIPTMVTAKVSG
jgi:Stage II sporulation protein E (SpoIIE)